MKKVMLLTIFAALMMISSAAVAQTTASGTLTVTATVTGSINLVFNSDAAGVALSSGAGTNAATLAFGNVSAFGAIPAGIVRSTTASNFTVSSAVDVLVTKTNSASANYTLESAAGLGGRSEHLGSRRRGSYQRCAVHADRDRHLCREQQFPGGHHRTFHHGQRNPYQQHH